MERFIFFILTLCIVIQCRAQSDATFEGIRSDDKNISYRYEVFINNSYRRNIDKPKESYSKDLKTFYKHRLESSKNRMREGHFLFNRELDNYLLSLKNHIAEYNPDYNFEELELLVSRYSWPNAFSIGDGTLAFNIGLLRKLENEQQLAFVICHEASHYFLNHAEKDFIRRYNTENSQEYKEKIEEIKSSEYYKATKLKELIKSNIYSERSHNRSLEFQADSLGLDLYLNAGYDLNEAIKLLGILETLNEPTLYTFDFYEMLKIDTVAYPSSSLIIADENPENVLHDDSLKTHPDCAQRIAILQKVENQHIRDTIHHSEDYHAFMDLINKELIHSYIYFDEVDDALLIALQAKHDGENSGENNTAIIVLLSKIVNARKYHYASSVVDKPNRHNSKVANDLAKSVFALRYKVLCNSFLDYAMTLYPESLSDHVTLYALIVMAKHARNRDLFEKLKNDFISTFPNSESIGALNRLTF